MINFSIKKDRDRAWKFANEIHIAKEEVAAERLVFEKDNKISELIPFIHPSGIFSKIVFGIYNTNRRKGNC